MLAKLLPSNSVARLYDKTHNYYFQINTLINRKWKIVLSFVFIAVSTKLNVREFTLCIVVLFCLFVFEGLIIVGLKVS